MTDLGPVLLALAVQVSLPLLGGLLLSRRRDPAAASGPLVLAMTAALVLTPLAFLPRPTWPTTASPAPAVEEGPPAEPVAAPRSAAPGGVNVLDLLRLAKPAAAVEAPARFNGWALVAWLAVGLAAFGLGRFAAGWLTVVRAVRRGTLIDPPALTALVEELRIALVCGPVRLLESSAVGSAATAGWLRPVVLVSPAWRTWSLVEVRAVLAHELAHVARGDFVTRLVGRLAVAVHAYHPLMRWVMARLELRQEMAADARAADVCGGRTAYRKCLAALALKADAAPVGPVPTFLSRPRTLLRRIAMLRVTDDAPVRSRRWPALAGVALLGAAALGLHGTRPEALAGPVVRVKAEEELRPDPLDVSFVFPADDKDFVGVYAARVGDLLKTPGLDAMAEPYTALIPAAFGEGKKTFFELKDVEQVSGRVSIRHEPAKPSPNRALMLSLSAVRLAKDFDWPKQLREWCADLKEHARGKAAYYSGKMRTPVLGPVDSVLWFYVPDGRTLVLESEENVKAIIDGKPTTKPTDWDKVEGGTFAIALTDPKTRLAKKLLPSADHKDETEKKVAAVLGEVFAKADSAVIGVDIGKTCRLTLSVSTTSRDDHEALIVRNKGIQELALACGDAVEKVGARVSPKPTVTAFITVESDPKTRYVTGLHVEYKGSLGDLLGGLK